MSQMGLIGFISEALIKLFCCFCPASQISMSGELTTAKTHLAALQNEVTSLRQREAELSSQLSKVTSEADKYRNELTRVKDSHTGLTATGLTLPLSCRLMRFVHNTDKSHYNCLLNLSFLGRFTARMYFDILDSVATST